MKVHSQKLHSGREFLVAALCIVVTASSPTTLLGQSSSSTSPPEPCTAYSGLWVQVNGVGTEEAQYVDAGESIREPAPPVGTNLQVPKTFASVVNTAGDLIFTIPSATGTRLGRLSASKQWQVLTHSGWSSGWNLSPLVVENTVLRIDNPTICPHPNESHGFIGVANASVHTGGVGFDIHNFRPHFTFDGSQFKLWDDDHDNNGSQYHTYFAKQVIPSHPTSLTSFAYDDSSQTG